jgi:UDP-GlcNAc:undecaprenyl-phosphate GlcNAc-1-phosphate transferase
MFTSFLAFTVALVVAAPLTRVVRDAARRWGLLDHALSARKIHGQPVPRLGGVAILAGFLAALALLLVVGDWRAVIGGEPRRAAGLLLGALGAAALGAYDDVRGTDARVKFAFQFGIAAVAYGLGLRIDSLVLPGLGAVELGALGAPLTLLWFVGITNAVNLVDGLDGLAGGIALIAAAGVFALAAGHGNALGMLVAAALGGAVLGFLIFNFHPASIFMGDSGSLFLGFALAATSIQTSATSSGTVALLVPVVLLGLPIADTLLAIGRRALRGAPLFSADRGHIHHRLLARGLTQRQAVLVLYGFAALLAFVAYVLAHVAAGGALVVVGLLTVTAYLALRQLGFFDLGRLAEVIELRRRNLWLRGNVAASAERLRWATGPDAVWSTVLRTAPALGADVVTLEIGLGSRTLTYRADLRGYGEQFVRERYGVSRERPTRHVLELGWSGRVDADVQCAVDTLGEHVAIALERIHGEPARAQVARDRSRAPLRTEPRRG